MKRYSDRTAQADQLANLVADQLGQAISEAGQAVLVVAGGSTPALFLNYLSKLELDWSRVIVIPSDERWVDSNHPRSNDRFIRQNLLINQATSATVVSLYVKAKKPADALQELEARITALKAHPDVCVLGMGEDAHIASLFPGADNLKPALDLETHKSVMPVSAPGADEPRITLTLAMLLRSKNIHLLITGNNKLETLNKARLAGDVEQMPVGAILNNDGLQIHYAE